MLWFCFKILRIDVHSLQLVVKVGQILRVSSPVLGPSALTVFAILAFFPLLYPLGSLLPQDLHLDFRHLEDSVLSPLPLDLSLKLSYPERLSATPSPPI